MPLTRSIQVQPRPSRNQPHVMPPMPPCVCRAAHLSPRHASSFMPVTASFRVLRTSTCVHDVSEHTHLIGHSSTHSWLPTRNALTGTLRQTKPSQAPMTYPTGHGTHCQSPRAIMSNCAELAPQSVVRPATHSVEHRPQTEKPILLKVAGLTAAAEHSGRDEREV